MAKFNLGDCVYFNYQDREDGYGVVVDLSDTDLVGVQSDEKLKSIHHDCRGKAKHGYGIFLLPEELERLERVPTPMEIVNDYHETKVAKTPFDTQVGGGHYKDMGIQPVEFILANELGFCEGNIIKYTCRYKQKGGVQDLKKVIHYAEMLIADIESKERDTF